MRSREVYARKIIREYKNKAFEMANDPLADEIVKELQERGYATVIVKFRSQQYIAISQRARENLVKLLQCRQEKLREELAELERCRKEAEGGTAGISVKEDEAC